MSPCSSGRTVALSGHKANAMPCPGPYVKPLMLSNRTFLSMRVDRPNAVCVLSIVLCIAFNYAVLLELCGL